MTSEEMIAMAREQRADGKAVTFGWDELTRLCEGGHAAHTDFEPVLATVEGDVTGRANVRVRRWVLA